MCNGLGKKAFKAFLEMFFDSIFYAFVRNLQTPSLRMHC